MAPRTLCGVSLKQFANQPTTAELARVVADLDSADIASFLCDLAEQFQNKYANSDRYVFCDIADQLHTLEETLCDGGGSRLLRELSSRLKEHA